MINIETLLSSFDERGTLLKWLKAVEKALNEATLTSVDVITISSTEIKLKFIFEDGTTIESTTITLPSGEGVSVINVTINTNNHLIVSLSDGTEIDAGEISIAVDSALSSTSENPVQNKVIYNALARKADANNVYTKTEADALLSAKANANNVYTKTEADALLSAKANANNVYTKTEANALLNAKANANNVYTKNEADTLFIKKMTLLWTNPNPTTNFSAQTVTIDLSLYNYYMILFTQDDNNDKLYTTGLIPKNMKTALHYSIASSWAPIASRNVTPVTNGLQFSTGKRFDTNNITTINDADERCRPIFIYGIE